MTAFMTTRGKMTMTMTSTGSTGMTAGLLLALVAGCSSQSASLPPPVSDELWELGGLLKDYTIEFDRGPAKLTDMSKNQPLYWPG